MRRGKGASTCPSTDQATLVVDAKAHVLLLCEGGHPNDRFIVRLGSRGLGKSREGDKKTPLGTYPLDPPRPSPSFGTFIPIGYPTESQRRLGFTGSAVGIHGPHRRMRWAGSLTNLFDTTDGCIGVATDEEMARVAAWVRSRRPVTVVIV